VLHQILRWCFNFSAVSHGTNRASQIASQKSKLLTQALETDFPSLISQDRFTYDLLHESALDGIPRTARPVLHSRALDALTCTDTPPSALARHAEEARRPDAELKHRLEAGVQAAQLHLFEEARAQFSLARQGLNQRSSELRLVDTAPIVDLYTRFVSGQPVSNEFDLAKEIFGQVVTLIVQRSTSELTVNGQDALSAAASS
jgi:hypothetical protein